MTQKETEELAISFSTYLNEVRNAKNIDSSEIANMATDMVKHLIKKLPSVKKEMFWNGEYEMLEELGITRSK